MSDDVCLAEFQKYLAEVKKSSANTLASYMRDVRQLEGYLNSHGLPGLAEAGEDDLLNYTHWLKAAGKSAATISRCIAITESLPPRSAAASPRSSVSTISCSAKGR